MTNEKEYSKLLLVGAGPIVIGQGSEYDYAAVQAARYLRSEGYTLVVADSNAAAVLSDRDEAERTYLEPLTADILEQIIIKEQPGAIVTAFGGQTALNLGYQLESAGVLKRYHVEHLGPAATVYEQTVDPAQCHQLLQQLGLATNPSYTVTTIGAGMEQGRQLGFPVVVRSIAAQEGAGVFIAYNQEELEDLLERAFKLSPLGKVAVEAALLGWVEIELELLRDLKGQSRVVTIMENLDPVGVHSGDSMTVIPPRGLDAGQQAELWKLATRIGAALGVVGLLNMQLAVSPLNGEIRVIELNPRFTFAGILAARASGLPLPVLTIQLLLGADLAALKLPTASTTTSVMVKLPRYDLAKFPAAEPLSSSAMRSVGAAVGFGLDFKEALQKAVCSLENGRAGLGSDGFEPPDHSLTPRLIREKIINSGPERLFYLYAAIKKGYSLADLEKLTQLSAWFLKELKELVAFEKELTTYALYNLPADGFLKAKRWGFSDIQLAYVLRTTEQEVRKKRTGLGVRPRFVASGSRTERWNEAAWFSSYGETTAVFDETGAAPYLVLGSGPNHIGAGAEQAYILAKAVAALSRQTATVLVDSNPTTVVGGSDQTALFFEPLQFEQIANIVEQAGTAGIFSQFGGAAAGKLVAALGKAGFPLIGRTEQNITSLRALEILREQGIRQPERHKVADLEQVLRIAKEMGYPVQVRTEAGGWAEVIFNPETLVEYFEPSKHGAKYPIYLEKYLDNAIGVASDFLADGAAAVMVAVMEHIEEASIHTGDSALSFPPYTVSETDLETIRRVGTAVAEKLQMKGLFHLKFGIWRGEVYLLQLEVGAGLTTPFAQKITGMPLIAAAVRTLLGSDLAGLQFVPEVPQFTMVKEAMLPFDRFPGVDPILGPEMRSTGSALGVAAEFGSAFIKAQLGVGADIPTAGAVFMSIREEDRRPFIPIAKQLTALGFTIIATEETARLMERQQIDCRVVLRISEGRPNILDELKNGRVQWIISIPSGPRTTVEERLIRTTAAKRGIPIITTVAGALAAVAGLEYCQPANLRIKPLQDY